MKQTFWVVKRKGYVLDFLGLDARRWVMIKRLANWHTDIHPYYATKKLSIAEQKNWREMKTQGYTVEKVEI